MIVVQAETYPELQDSVNLDQFLGNDQKVNEYFKCLMETGPCTQKGEAIRREYLHKPNRKASGKATYYLAKLNILFSHSIQNIFDLNMLCSTKFTVSNELIMKKIDPNAHFITPNLQFDFCLTDTLLLQ